ncbi:uncharacterized protein LODBEIA_P39730 [Lodderomyces beijingensis]|uniref:Cytochrome P450 n=1 Tax=Lodderomyces beijingensis TaxID=1775926 RepID=A0ABP0ZNM3_9ASCO
MWAVPGPYIHRVSRIPSLNYQRKHAWIRRVCQLHQQYGPVVLLSPNEVSVNGSDKFIHDIYTHNLPKSDFYANFTNHGGKDNIFASLANDKHLHYKKMIHKLYSKSAIFSKENDTRGVIVDATRKLIEVVHQSSISGQQPDIHCVKPQFNLHAKGHRKAWFNKSGRVRNLGIETFTLFGCLAMDVVSRFELGKDNGSDLMSNPQQRRIVMEHRIVSSMGFWTTLMPRFWEWAATKLVMQCLVDITQFQLNLYALAEKNLISNGKNSTTLQALNANGLHGEYAYSFLTDNLFAGHETTAVQLCYLAYELSRPAHAPLQAQLRQELVANFGRPTFKNDVIDDLEKLDKLPFLNALILENSRVHTSIPGAEPRVVDQNTYQVNNLKIPAGTIISCLPYALHREPSVFPDPDSFKPHRWLPLSNANESHEAYTSRIKLQQKYMMPFGKGIRMCLGMNIAQIEMKAAIANLYWHFHSQIDDDWCQVLDNDDPIKLGRDNVPSPGVTDQDLMCMNDYYTTSPVGDECWLRWFEN